MSFNWLKRYMPRSLYARAALILVVPIVALQIVVSVVFIKRDLEDVTVQMAATIQRELELLRQVAEAAPDQETALAQMAPLTLRATKEAMRRVAVATRVEDTDLIEMCYMSRDFRHGMEAFLAKEKPEWSGT